MNNGTATLDRLTFDGVLAIARREILMLAVTSQTHDLDTQAVSAARLRWALQRLASRAVEDARETDVRYVAVQRAAKRWLPVGPALGLPATTLARLLDRWHEPSVGGRLEASSTTLDALELDDLELTEIQLRRAKLLRISGLRARFDRIDAIGATFDDCCFEASSMGQGIFDDSFLARCDLSRTNLERARFRAARLTGCDLNGSVLTNANINHAIFTDCDFRGTSFAATSATTLVTVVNARFIRCDLRASGWAGRCLDEVSFVDCKFYGAHGAPWLEDVVIERPDLSSAADGSRIGTKSDVDAGWRTLVGRVRT
ncbi:MAG: pentapeptide repeat-containing protein [Kofleriaceae bacterium]